MTEVIPAYGRDYKTAKEAKEAWQAGQDFIIQNFFSPYDGKPINKQDAKPGEIIGLRYRQKTQLTIVKGGV